MGVSRKLTIAMGVVLTGVLMWLFFYHTNVSAQEEDLSDVCIGGFTVPSGSYLPNGAEDVTTEKPESGGYVYYEDGVITLNNAQIYTKEDESTYLAGIEAFSDVKIILIGENQIGKKVDSPTTALPEILDIGIYAPKNVLTGELYDITVTGSGNLSIYDNSKGIWGKNITIDMTGNLNIMEYGLEEVNMPECCLKAEKGTITVKNGNLDLRSFLAYPMYADNGININGGNIKTRTGSMGGKRALNLVPVLGSENFQIEVSNETDVDKSSDMVKWNGTDDLTGFFRVNFTYKIPENKESDVIPSATSSPAPSTTPETVSKTDNNKTASIKKVSWKSLKNKKKKKAVVKWKKVSGADGYQIQYATNRKFKNKKGILTKKTKHIIKKLKKKKYYVRIRAYKMNGKKKIYGKWSVVKKVRIKK